MSNPKLANNYLVIGNSYLEDGNLLKAKKFFKKAYMADPCNIEILYEFALFHAEYNEGDQALDYYNEILDIDEKQAGAHYGKAIIYDENGDSDKALDSYKEAIKHDEEYFHAYLYLADIYDRRGEDDTAEMYYEKAIKVDSDSIWGLMNYGSFLEEKDRNEEALVHFEHALSLAEDHYLALFNKAVVLAKLGYIDEAILCYEKSAEQNVKHPYTFLNWAVLFKNMEKYNLAEEVISRGIYYNNEVSVLYYNRGLFNTYLSNFDDAIYDLKYAVELSPSLRNYAIKDNEYSELFKYKNYDEFL